MKKGVLILLTFLSLVALVVGIFKIKDANKNQINTDNAKSNKIRVVATIFPLYDWTKNIIKGCQDDVDLKLIANTNVDMHSFQPTPDDVINIENCDLLIYTGGESEEWVEDCLKNPKIKIVKFMDVLKDKVKAEEYIQGMQKPQTGSKQSYENEIEYDEHVWLSVKNASVMIGNIAEALVTVDNKNAQTYLKNAGEYDKLLTILDSDYEKSIAESKNKTLIFADRFPFRYLFDDYNLSYYVAFNGCSSETDASFETIIFLSKKVDELNAKHIYILKNSDSKIAESVIGNSARKDANILKLDSMQSFDSQAYNNGEGDDYISIMYLNLESIKKSLE